jgi:hypothetical protein
MVEAKSRTFIPAKLSDNPDLAADGEYARILNNLPKELRDAYRDGQFRASLQDEPNQCIPTAWVQAAMSRWTAQPPVGVPMCAIGVDVAQGGSDNTVLAPRHDGWFAELLSVPGKDTLAVLMLPVWLSLSAVTGPNALSISAAAGVGMRMPICERTASMLFRIWGLKTQLNARRMGC